MTFKVVCQLNTIDTMEILMKHSCMICMEERLTVLKRICDKCVTFIKKDSKIDSAEEGRRPGLERRPPSGSERTGPMFEDGRGGGVVQEMVEEERKLEDRTYRGCQGLLNHAKGRKRGKTG